MQNMHDVTSGGHWRLERGVVAARRGGRGQQARCSFSGAEQGVAARLSA